MIPVRVELGAGMNRVAKDFTLIACPHVGDWLTVPCNPTGSLTSVPKVFSTFLWSHHGWSVFFDIVESWPCSRVSLYCTWFLGTGSWLAFIWVIVWVPHWVSQI